MPDNDRPSGRDAKYLRLLVQGRLVEARDYFAAKIARAAFADASTRHRP